jgi:hypothetical protein
MRSTCDCCAANDPTRIHFGSVVSLGGNLFAASGRLADPPTLRMEDHVSVGWHCSIVVNREVLIEELL